MKKLLFILVSLISLSASAQRVKVSPEALTPGCKVTITYNPETTVMKGRDDVKCVVYCWKNYNWEAIDMPLDNNGSQWQCSFNVPDSVSLLAWKYYTKDTVDVGSGEWEYAYYIQQQNHRNMPSANIGWAFLRGENTQELGGIPSMQNVQFSKKDDAVVRMWINNELRDNPEELRNVFWYASKFMASDTTAANKSKLENNLKLVLNMDSKNNYDENFLLKALDIAQNVIGNKTLAADIIGRITKRYPNGEYFREIAAKELFMKKDKTNEEQDFLDFIKRFPPQKFENSFVYDNMFDHWYGNLLRSYVYNPIIKRNDYSNVVPSFPWSPLMSVSTYFWHIVQIPYERGDVSAEKIYPMALQIRNAVLSKERVGIQKSYSPKEWKEKLFKDYSFAWFDFAKILNDVNKTSESMALVDSLVVCFDTKNADFNDFRVKMLQNTGRTSEIIGVIKGGLKDNAASPDMLAYLKTDYVKQHGSEEGFETYTNGLKSASLVDAQRKEALEKLIKTPVKYFSMEKMQGGRLDMNSLKGKIIVIDFWATWCGPCKAAMPGMQMVVNKYKNDADVQFLFVATMETDKAFKEKIQKFIKDKGYNFQVCYDEPTEKGKREKIYSSYASQFKSSGIPMKMVIDGDGNARWVSNGYYGSPTALVDELSTVIDYLKSEK